MTSESFKKIGDGMIKEDVLDLYARKKSFYQDVFINNKKLDVETFE